MAVKPFFGKDSNAFALDIFQFKTDVEKAQLKEEIKKHKDLGGAFNEDGLIFFAPEMNLFLLDFDSNPLKSKYFFLRLPWEDSDYFMNWTPFFRRVSKEFNWNCFSTKTAFLPDYTYNKREIFYKAGIMPAEPVPTKKMWFKQIYEVEQGDILYKNHDVWEVVNKELAFNNNVEPFVAAVEKYDIIV